MQMVQAVPFEVPRLRALARHSLPHLLEATIAPLALFYLSLWLIGVWGALGVTIWLLVSQPLPVFLLARTIVSLTFTGAAIAGSTAYFKRSMRRHGMLVTS